MLLGAACAHLFVQKDTLTLMDISIVIPVYNSSKTLAALAQRLLSTLDMMGKSFEIIFVDDGSLDNSSDLLKVLLQSRPDCIKAIILMRNYGQHNALMCGFRHAQGRYVVTMDDDLQNPPEEISKLYKAITEQQLDLVYGSPEIKKHEKWRNLGSWIVNAFYRYVFRTQTELTSFRIIRKELVNSILTYTLNYTFIDGLLAWNTQRIGSVTVEHHLRKSGTSGYSFRRLVVLALNLFTNFSLLPLQVASACGVAAAIGGLLAGGYYLVKYIFSAIAVPGYASTIIAILILGGIQLLAVGIMGEYLGRLHLNVNRKPQYIERYILEAQDYDQQPRS